MRWCMFKSVYRGIWLSYLVANNSKNYNIKIDWNSCMPYIGFPYACHLNVGQQPPLWKQGTRFDWPVILTAVIILVFLVFTLIIYVFLMFFSCECSDRHVAQGYKSHLWWCCCLQPRPWTLLSSRQDIWSTHRLLLNHHRFQPSTLQ